MELIPRIIQNQILSAWEKRKIAIIYGPRQTGKTTLLHSLQANLNEPILWVDGDRSAEQEIYSSRNFKLIENAIGTHKYVMFDEAQRIPNIGINLKIIHDHFPGVRVVATGSSSFELANTIREPLTGRTRTFMLYPIALMELKSQQTVTDTIESLSLYLRFGLYPEVLSATSDADKIDVLTELSESTLFKDILALENIKNPRVLRELITLLALQIGNEVSLAELANRTNVSIHTVKRYLDLFEKSFLVFRLGGFSRNLRNEVTKNAKYYFYDVGLRNAITNSFNTLSLRDDIGALWENFLIAERLKMQKYQRLYSNNYFWRTYTQQEVDWLEDRGGKLYGYEFKWKAQKVRPPAAFMKTYPDSEFSVVDRENFRSFVTPVKPE